MATKAKSSRTSGKAAGPVRELSTQELSEALIAVPEIAEAFTRADLELALDDRGWLTTNSATLRELDPQTRRVLLSKSRMYWNRDPMAKHAVRLWTVYCFGEGFSWSCKDKKTTKLLKTVLQQRQNRTVLSAEGQQKNSRKLLIDGDIFFAVFGAEGETKIFRRMDPLQITHLITDPDDDEHVLAYRRQMSDGKTTKFYADWAATEEDRALAEEQKCENEKVRLEEDVVLYHAAFDAVGKWGNGLLFPVIDWTREHRRFMESRVALQQALSKYAHKLTVKGGQQVIDQAKQRLQSTYAQNGPAQIERNPTPAPGATWLQNAGATLEAMPRATGAGDGEKDSNQLKLMVCAGTAIMLHYFGDPGTTNLATATAMELPMLKTFLAYQRFWKDVLRDLFAIALDEDPDDEAAEIDIDFPPILKDDLTGLAQAITSLVSAFPEIAVDEVLRMCLVSLGLDDVDTAMKSIVAKREENALKAADIAAGNVAPPTAPPGPGAKKKPESDANSEGIVPAAQNMSTEAALRLAESLDRLSLSLGRA